MVGRRPAEVLCGGAGGGGPVGSLLGV
ncbi:MAG: hypothetical protein JWN00_1890, partial [Actinomycetia bacterium]|nr:hypothetical protein [Actinomycetes bacterium]